MTAQEFEIPNWENLNLLRETRIGRMCIVDKGYPLAIPVSFAVTRADEELKISVRTAPTTMLGRYEGPASLEVDCIDLDNGFAWSVFVRGSLRRVVGEHGLPNPRPLVEVNRYQWLVLEPSAITGRRFVIEPSEDGYFVEWQLV